MSRTLISVVIPVYNGERYIDECLDSVSAAVARVPAPAREGIEAVVCDNWSADRTLEAARSWDPGCPVRVIQPAQHEENRTRNWAHGLGAGTGEWLMMLHADDLLAPTALTSQLDCLESPAAASASLISGRYRTFESDPEAEPLRPRWPLPGLMSGPRFARSVLPLHCPLVPFTLMRRGAYDKVGGLDDRWELVQDWVLWMRLAQVGDVLLHSGEVGRWRMHPTSPAYRRLNADEHLKLAEQLPQIVPGVASSVQGKAREAARAKAAIQLDGSGENGALGPLPDPGEARRTLRANGLRVSARFYALRVLALARWLTRR